MATIALVTLGIALLYAAAIWRLWSRPQRHHGESTGRHPFRKAWW